MLIIFLKNSLNVNFNVHTLITHTFWEICKYAQGPFSLSNSSLAYHHRARRTCKIQKTALAKTHHKTKTELKQGATSASI